MKKLILATICNDLHIDEGNIKELHKLIKEQCEFNVKNKVKYIFIAGDLFQSRISQRQNVMVGMGQLFDIINSYELEAIVIPGNHDKTNYKLEESFLDPFATHPAVELIRDNNSLHINDTLVQFLPYFDFNSDLWVSNLNAVLSEAKEHKGKNVLIGHFAVEGSINNDGSKVTSGLKRSDLKPFDKVFLGHYHNTHSVNKDITHLPSIRQNNYGEDHNKGFTVLYDDLSYEIVNTNFTKYTVYRFNLDTDDLNEIIQVANEVQIFGGNNRFEFIGSSDRIKGFDASRFEDMGINIKKLYNSLESPINDDSNDSIFEVRSWDEESIKSKFCKFCEDNKLDHTYGLEILEKIILKSNGKEI